MIMNDEFHDFIDMSTERLRVLLSLDISESSCVSLLPEQIAQIMSIIQEREEEAGNQIEVDTAAAWKDFNENYRHMYDEDWLQKKS